MNGLHGLINSIYLCRCYLCLLVQLVEYTTGLGIPGWQLEWQEEHNQLPLRSGHRVGKDPGMRPFWFLCLRDVVPGGITYCSPSSQGYRLKTSPL